VSSDQVSAVLIAFIVTGIAILILLAGALLTRRGRTPEREAPLAAAASEPIPAPAVAPVPWAVPTPVPAQPLPPVAQIAPPPPAEEPSQPAPVADHPPEEPAVTTADREAAALRVHDPREQEVIEGFLSIAPRPREAAFEAPREPTASAPVPPPEPAAAAATQPEPAPPPVQAPEPAASSVPPDPYVDDATGLDSRAAWERVLAEENARYLRYRRPVGVVVAELDGLGRFEGQFGADAARRILAAVGETMRRTARRTDHVAHVGEGRFLVMLPETDEIQAINYVERVRGECERWLDAGAVALHVSLGWASPSAVGELDSALRTAEERMYAERRRLARGGALGTDATR
jgi:diguanylate cyclase (GGDEF)-like protein